MPSPIALHGSCLCQDIKYTASRLVGPVLHCHCSMCRKATGAAFRTRVSVPSDALHWLTGEALLGRYDSSPGETRTFCGRCGATLVTFFKNHPHVVGLALGTLDADPVLRPAAHVYVASKAPWYDITDDLPQFPDALPASFALRAPKP